MLYRLMIFISKDKLSALDFSGDNKPERISFDGNLYHMYYKVSDLENFIETIKDYYNILSFNDIEISVQLISLEAKQEYINELYNAFTESFQVNVIDGKKIAPLLFIKNREVKRNNSYLVKLYDTTYKLTIDENLMCMCTVVYEEINTLYIEDNQYSILYNFDYNLEIKNKDEIDSLKCDFEKKVNELQEKLNQIENDYCVLQNENKELKNKIKKLENIKKEYRKSEKRCLIYLPSFEEFNEDLKFVIFSKFGVDRNLYTIKQHALDGAYIEKGTIIAEVMNENSSKKVTAPISGRLYYMFPNNTRTTLDSHDSKKKTVIAIIGGLEDTWSSVMNWYGKIK